MAFVPKMGKLEWKTLSKFLSLLPVKDVDVIMGPSQGENAPVIRLEDGFLVVRSNPITTGAKRAGYLAVHVAGNGIAVRGVKPKWFLPVILLPSRFSEKDVLEFFKDMAQALNEIGGVALSCHTEIALNITRPLVTMTAIGYTKTRVILARDARVGDLVYVIGRVAGEGVGIMAWDFENKLLEKGVDRELINVAKKFVYDVSAVDTALRIKDYVNTMHDAAEGGVLQALREIAVASGTAIVIHRDKIPLEKPIETIAKYANVDPLKLLSSGCIIVTVPPNKREAFEKVIEDLGKPFSQIGYVVEGNGEVVVKERNRAEIIKGDLVDEIYKLWQQSGETGA